VVVMPMQTSCRMHTKCVLTLSPIAPCNSDELGYVECVQL
jgi:hypothetical protein